jgi:uncharacterized protein YraI
MSQGVLLMRRIVWVTVALLLVLPLLAWGPDVSPALAERGNQWTGEYFNNRDLAGAPVHVRLDPAVDFNWGGASPVPGIVPENDFSVRWTGAQNFPEGGIYTFLATVDDGVRVFVDDRIVIDAWYSQTPTLHTGQATLTAGTHWVRVEYFDAGAQASISFLWRPANALVPPGGWEAYYYSNVDLTGSRVSAGVELNLDHNWGSGSPIPGTIPADGFGARWYGFPEMTGGTYTFVAWADDGVRVYAAGQLVIDAWGPSIYQEHRGTVTLGPGTCTVQVDYREDGDQARIFVYWIQDSGLPPGFGAPSPAAPVVPSSITATVTTGMLNVRSGPGSGWPILTRVRQFETYTVIARNADTTWYQISGPGFTGWVSARYVTLNADPSVLPVAEGGGTAAAPTVLQVRSNVSLRIRRGPSANQARVAALNPGETAIVIGRTADSSWLKVRTGDGTEGWVSSAYVSYVPGGLPLNAIPITG